MIATCPECRKRYRLADDVVPAGGRSVRCAACGHGWTVLPDGSAAPPIVPPPEPPVAAPEPLRAGEPAPPPGRPHLRRSHLRRPRPAPAPFAEAQEPAASPAPRPLSFSEMRDALAPAPRRRRRWGWLAALVALLAVGALAVIEFAPEDTFDPPRLGLPAPHLSARRPRQHRRAARCRRST